MTTTTTTLCAIFAAVLGVPEVDAQEGFFDLGGDSVLALQLVTRARAAGLVLTVRDVFDHQSAARLATVASALPVVPAPAEPPLVDLGTDQRAEFVDLLDADEDSTPDGAEDGVDPDGETEWETVT